MTTTLATPSAATEAPATGRSRRRWYVGGVMILIGAYGLVAFGLGTRTAHGRTSTFGLDLVGAGGVDMPDLKVPAATTAMVLSVICVALGVARMAVEPRRLWRVLTTTAFLACFIAAFLVWATANQSLNFASVLNATVLAAVPLILGALCGVLCERSGVINVAIEGQFLFGACAAAFTASLTGSLWAGLVAGCLAGALLGAILAVFANRYKVQQVVLGVVLNLLAAGLTGFLYDRILQPNSGGYNQALAFPNLRIPGLVSIPVIGPVLFNQNIIVYATMVLIAVVQFGLFHTRWGLRTRAVGEHPTAADTVGIKVLATRYRNVIIGGLISGLGGVWLTIGLNIPFNKNMAAGQGFIALAALIFGRWSPLGALSAALLFGFFEAISTSLQPLGTPVPSQFLTMAPYLATIFAVAGLVGHVRAPAADGQPYG
ncbi:MAG: inner-rane translocator [Actinoallomurus sp.]|nr:inner-rane translocator [Actinoallomurus sp.]